MKEKKKLQMVKYTSFKLVTWGPTNYCLVLHWCSFCPTSWNSSTPTEWNMVVVLRCARQLALMEDVVSRCVKNKNVTLYGKRAFIPSFLAVVVTDWVVQGDRYGTRQDKRMGNFAWDVCRKCDMSRPHNPPWISPVLSALEFHFCLLL
jgi:hypothetical protein